MSRFWPYLVIILAVLFLFSPIWKTYAFTDVYEYLYNARNSNFINVFIQSGRPVYGVLNKFAFTHIERIDQLGWLRFFGVAGLGLTVLSLYFMVHHLLLNKAWSLLVAILFLFTPSANIIGIWVATFQVGWAMLMGLWSGYLALSMLTVPQSRQSSIWKGLLVLVLGVLSLQTYQPGFTMFIIPGLLYLLRYLELRRIGWFLTIYIGIYIVYYAVHKLTMLITALPMLTRSAITPNPLFKLLWFGKTLWMVAYDNFVFYRLTGMVVMAGFSVALIAWAMYKSTYPLKGVNLFWVLAIFIVLSFSAYLPNLIASDNWISYRTMSTLFAMKWILIVTGLSQLQKRFRYVWVLCIVMGLVLVINSWNNINKGLVEIQSEEYAIVRSAVESMKDEMRGKKKLLFIMPTFEFLAEQGFVPRAVTDEFGNLSTSRYWVPGPMVKQILREAHETDLEQELQIIKLKSEDRADAIQYQGVPVIDVERLYLEEHR